MSSSSSSSPEIAAAQSTEDTFSRFSYADATHEEVLDDLSSRFILNLPDEELSSLERICFQVEQAHWYYEDFIREENPSLPSLPLKKFSEMLFHACPLLHQWSHDHEQAFNTFMQYKTRVPVCGAIMLNDTWDKCVLVKGWKSSSGWGFPKGKINEDEPPAMCAVREVLEETGYNLQEKIDPRNVIEMSIKEQKVSLYIVPGVPEDFPFKTKTRKEISKIEWFKLTDLPTWKRNKQVPGKFYLISPFIGALKAFINERKPRNVARKPKTKKPHGTLSYQQQNENGVHLDQDPAQESSSSADNAGPQTPSPHYPEPTVNTVNVGTTESSSTPAPLDPHFARLLSSLTLSASKDAPASIAAADTVPLPVPDNNPALAKESDWSSSTPSRSTDKTSPLNNGSSVISSTGIHSEKNHVVVTQSTSRSPPALVNGTPRNHNDVKSPRLSQDTVVSSTLGSLSPRSTTARRSSTADISPYLSRAVEIPSSAKRLKQLALLEAVADESARMTPVIAARAATATPGMDVSFPANGSFGYAPGLNVNRQGNDPNVLYSTSPSAGKALLSYNSSAQYEPLQTRARTSQAFHRPQAHLPGTMSMSQGQLLAMMNPGGLPPHAASLSQSPVPVMTVDPRQQRSAMYNNTAIMGGMSNTTPHPHLHPPPQYVPRPIPMHAMGPPTQQMHVFPQQSPYLAQTPMPVLNHGVDSLPRAPNTSSTALLSILNGNKP